MDMTTTISMPMPQAHLPQLAFLDATGTIDSAVSVNGLSIRYGANKVLDDLNWCIPKSQVVGLLGRNGAGKTTLLESLLGLRAPLCGEVHLLGQPVTALDDSVKARIGYVPQRSDLFDWLTAVQMLDYFRSFYPRWDQAKVDALLSAWEIDRHAKISRLSPGQQQRLAIIRALAHQPDLLVLDEPVASLDPVGRRDFLRELVEQVLNRGTTVVFSTHILSDLERVAFDVAFLVRGRISLFGTLDDLLESTRRLTGAEAGVRARVQSERLQIMACTVLADQQVQMLVRAAPRMPPPISQGSVVAEAVTLEDLFMGMTQ